MKARPRQRGRDVALTPQPSKRARPFPTTLAALLALLVASSISWSLAPAPPRAGPRLLGLGTSINPFDPAPSGVGRANLDGTGVDQSFITFHGNPIAVAVDDAHIYWLNTDIRASTIGRANLDGTGVEPSFIPGVGFPSSDLTVDDAHIYWGHVGGIGRANLDGTGVKPAGAEFITTSAPGTWRSTAHCPARLRPRRVLRPPPSARQQLQPRQAEAKPRQRDCEAHRQGSGSGRAAAAEDQASRKDTEQVTGAGKAGSRSAPPEGPGAARPHRQGQGQRPMSGTRRPVGGRTPSPGG